MKTINFFLIMVLFCFSANNLFGEELLSNEERHAQYEKVVGLISAENSVITVVKKEIERLENMIVYRVYMS